MHNAVNPSFPKVPYMEHDQPIKLILLYFGYKLPLLSNFHDRAGFLIKYTIYSSSTRFRITEIKDIK